MLSQHTLALVLGLAVLVAVGLSMVTARLRPTPGTLVSAGFASGFMGTTTSVGGPPMALVYQRSDGPAFRSTLAIYFAAGAVMSLTALAIAGRVGAHELRLGLLLWPGVVVGFLLSKPLTRYLDDGRTRAMVLAISAAAALLADRRGGAVRRAPRRAWRWALLPVGVLVWLGLLAGPAAADAARPGDVRSQVTAVTPSSAGIHAEVLGGDSFLHLRVDPGTEVVVIGYQEEPYLRVAADGTVQINDRSPARWLNEKRLADVPVPPSADPTAPPAWRTIGHGGSVSWHDHRTHWMATTKPDPPVREWSVPLRVDDRAVTIEGRYAYVTPPPIWLWWAVAAAIAMITTVVAWTRVAMAGAVVGPTGVLVVVVGWALWRVPGGNSAGATAMVLGVIAVAGAVAGWWGRRGTYAGAFVAASGAALVAYALPRITVFEHAVLITQLPAIVDRLSVAAAVGAGGAALALGFRAVANPVPRPGDEVAPGQLGGYHPSGTRASASGGPQDPLA